MNITDITGNTNEIVEVQNLITILAIESIISYNYIEYDIDLPKHLCEKIGNLVGNISMKLDVSPSELSDIVLMQEEVIEKIVNNIVKQQ